MQRMNKGFIEPCLFGQGGTCCRNCSFGPCMMIEDIPESIGICGATPATVAARNFCRMVAAGASAHMDHALETALTFLATAKGETPFEIKDEKKLRAMAEVFEVKTEGRSTKDIAIELGEKALAEFGKQEGGLYCIRRAPEKRQEVWKKMGVAPRGIQREVVEIMHRTHMGTDQDYRNLILQATRCALADGWGGSMISTELQDIMFGTPVPTRSVVNLGALSKDEVNVVIHGHEPVLAEAMALVTEEPEMIEAAKKVGAKGINLVGVCCTGNEVLMRHGIPVAGAFVQQEIVLSTGAVEAMVNIPENKMDVVVGFSHETINHMLGGAFRASYRPLNDNIINGRIRGVGAIVGCDSVYVRSGYMHTTVARELIANNVLVLTTGCAATACGRAGLLTPEAASLAGPGLREVCETVGMPPVLHMGSCVDNSRILIAATQIVLEGGLGDDIAPLPAAGCAPEWMSEKAIAIGQYFVGSGVPVVFGRTLPTTGSKVFSDFLFNGIKDFFGGSYWVVEEDPVKIAQLMMRHIENARVGLGIQEKKERVLFDMAMRREL
jgi:carbon-monoxide dehydrogenase catalytic subunit